MINLSWTLFFCRLWGSLPQHCQAEPSENSYITRKCQLKYIITTFFFFEKKSTFFTDKYQLQSSVNHIENFEKKMQKGLLSSRLRKGSCNLTPSFLWIWTKLSIRRSLKGMDLSIWNWIDENLNFLKKGKS